MAGLIITDLKSESEEEEEEKEFDGGSADNKKSLPKKKAKLQLQSRNDQKSDKILELFATMRCSL